MSETEIQEEAPRLEPVVEMDVTYSRSGDKFVLTQTVDGKTMATKPATATEFLLCEILKELRTLNATAAAQAEEDKNGN